MNRRFRLGAVERLRAGKLAEAARALGLARRELADAVRHKEKVATELTTTRASATGLPVEHESAAARRQRLREELRAAGDRCSIAASREVAALAAWNAARADLRVVEALHERHRLALAEADARAEQRETDELAGQVRPRPDEEEPVDVGAGLVPAGEEEL